MEEELNTIFLVVHPGFEIRRHPISDFCQTDRYVGKRDTQKCKATGRAFVERMNVTVI